MRSEKTIEGVEYFLDDVITGNHIFLLTNKLNLICLQIKPAKSALVDQESSDEHYYSGSTLVLEWEAQLGDITSSQAYGLAYYEKSGKIFIVSEHQAIELDSNTMKQRVFSFEKQLSPPTYVAIKQDHLFVRRRDSSFQAYSLATFPEQLTPERSLSEISCFDVDEYQLEFMESNHWSAVQDTPLEPNVFFVDSYTKKQWTDSLKTLFLSRKLVYLVSPTKLQLLFWDEKGLSQPVDVKIKGFIPEGERVQILRFDDMIYIMVNQAMNESAVKTCVAELFLTEQGKTATVNNVWYFNGKINKIYVDENHLYTIGDSDNLIFIRGVSVSFLPQAMPQGRAFGHEQVHNLFKVYVNGYPSLVAVSPHRAVSYDIQTARHVMRCPPRQDKATFNTFGTYSFQVNVTTRSCAKKADSREVFGEEAYLKIPCVFTTNMTINYFEKDLLVHRYSLASVLGVILILLLLLAVCVIAYRRRLAKLNQEHEILKKEIMMYKDKQKYTAAKTKLPDSKYKLNKSTDSIGFETAENQDQDFKRSKSVGGTDKDGQANNSKLDYTEEA